MATAIPVLEEIVEGKITTVIADDLEIKGTIKFKSSVMLKGVFEGEIQSEGLLVVGPTAKVTATITTKTLVSQGEITGNVTAGEQIVLKGTATHSGDLRAPFITVDNGAVFNGAAVMERRQEGGASSKTHEEETVAVRETATYEPFVTQTLEEKGAPFVMTRHDPNKRQSKEKMPTEESEKAEGSVDFVENTGTPDKPLF
jgi:cytoskeletal protein CcmA (bactofilin family)